MRLLGDSTAHKNSIHLSYQKSVDNICIYLYIKNLKKYKHLTKIIIIANIYHYNDIDHKSSVLSS